MRVDADVVLYAVPSGRLPPGRRPPVPSALLHWEPVQKLPVVSFHSPSVIMMWKFGRHAYSVPVTVTVWFGSTPYGLSLPLVLKYSPALLAAVRSGLPLLAGKRNSQL